MKTVGASRGLKRSRLRRPVLLALAALGRVGLVASSLRSASPTRGSLAALGPVPLRRPPAYPAASQRQGTAPLPRCARALDSEPLAAVCAGGAGRRKNGASPLTGGSHTLACLTSLGASARHVRPLGRGPEGGGPRTQGARAAYGGRARVLPSAGGRSEQPGSGTTGAGRPPRSDGDDRGGRSVPSWEHCEQLFRAG